MTFTLTSYLFLHWLRRIQPSLKKNIKNITKSNFYVEIINQATFHTALTFLRTITSGLGHEDVMAPFSEY